MNRSQQIKNWAQELGFLSCGVTKAVALDDEARKLEAWLNQDMHGNMHYMNNHFEMRVNPQKLMPGTKSIVSLLFNYYTDQKNENPNVPKISTYAYGRDYHKVVRKRMQKLMQKMKDSFGDLQMRCFVDSAPVMDKVWAKKAGLGWIGKNSNLLSKKTGSFFFIGSIFVDLDLEYDGPALDHCGSCTACIEACPTDAISEAYVVNGSKCISYFTIELKDHLSIPSEYKGKFENWAFGCDICQDVCPWNRFSVPHNEPDFMPKGDWLGWNQNDWETLKEETFENNFGNTPLKRTKFSGLMRNIRFVLSE